MKLTNKCYFSWWIANLGVVPLFLFCAFLLAPCLVFLFALLVLVTRVRETIPNLLLNYLPECKDILVIFTLVKTTLFLTMHSATASPSPQAMYLAIGEHAEISVENLTKFSVGNSQVIGHRHDQTKNILLIKGKSQGFSEIVVWFKNKQKKKIPVYVISKKGQLSWIQIKQVLELAGLQTNELGGKLQVTGIVENYQNLSLIRQFIPQDYPNLIWMNDIALSLRNRLIGEAYKHLEKLGLGHLSCQYKNIITYCTYSSSPIPLSKKTIKNLYEQHYIKLIQTQILTFPKNYRLRFKFIQIERLDGSEVNLGLNKLEGFFSDIFKKDLLQILEKNPFFLQNKNLHVSTLAEPELVIKIEQEGNIKMGSEIPYSQNQGNETLSTQWKFAGLEIKVKLIYRDDKLTLVYSSTLSSPVGEQISGHSESSEIFITQEKSTSLFNIGIKTIGKNQTSIPYISSIPLLGRIFTSSSDIDTYKFISGFAEVQEVH